MISLMMIPAIRGACLMVVELFSDFLVWKVRNLYGQKMIKLVFNCFVFVFVIGFSFIMLKLSIDIVLWLWLLG